jgi:hypothetical protein
MRQKDLIFRTLEARDAKILLSSYCTYLREFNYGASESDYLPFLRDTLGQNWIVSVGGFCDDKLYAFAVGSLDVSTLRRSKALKLFDLYVDKRFRGGKAVHHLLESVYKECERRGIVRIFGNAEPTTQGFFLRYGWQPSHQSLIVFDL